MLMRIGRTENQSDRKRKEEVQHTSTVYYRMNDDSDGDSEEVEKERTSVNVDFAPAGRLSPARRCPGTGIGVLGARTM